MSTAAATAAVQYIARAARLEQPAGDLDAAGCFWPDVDEWASCCEQVVRPTRAQPQTYLQHCRSMRHLAYLHQTTIRAVRAAQDEDPYVGIVVHLITESGMQLRDAYQLAGAQPARF